MAGAVNKIKGLKVFIGVLIQCQELLINVLVFKKLKVVIGGSHKHKALVNKIKVLEVMMGGFRKQ